MLFSRWIIALIVPFILFQCSHDKKLAVKETADTETVLSEDQHIPIDSRIVKGKLANGLTYYIRKNSRPEKRAELRLAVNAGSILEDDDQQGLAHFCEHMAFNGTENFKKHELVNYLESIGMRFGPEINAYTSFDETVYMLELPTDSTEILETGFQVLEDWAHLVSYEDEEINKERGVVIEEWRLGRGAAARMRDEIYPVLFHGSRYAERLPIGKKEVLDTFKVETPRRFYKDWYRPDLMAVVAVGDFDVTYIETLIKKQFGNIPVHENPRDRKLFDIPGHEETLFAIASDPEAPRSMVTVYFKFPAEEDNTVGDYRKGILENIYSGMFNNRLNELAQDEDPPFIFGYSGKGRFVRTSQVYMLAAMVRDNGIERGLDALLTEAERVKKYGFTETELQRQKQAVLRSMEKAYAERNKIESPSLAAEYIRNFLFNEPVPGIEYEYLLYQKLVPGITLEEINQLAKELVRSESRVVAVESPEKESITVPTEADLKKVFAAVGEKEIVPYSDDVLDIPLLASVPDPKPVVSETIHEELGVTEWELPNGARVFAKPTDFKNDEIRFSATSNGGLSLVADEALIPGQTAASVVAQGGLGAFSQIQLQKLLSNKVVSVSPYINELSEGFSGETSPKDLETLFQLVYLYFYGHRKDSTAFISYKKRLQSFYQNRGVQPETAWRDTISVTLTQHHPRYRPVSAESFEEMDLNTSFDIYKDRFADAGDFMFFFVGNFDITQLKTFTETYLSNLPTQNREESWKDVTYAYPEGVITKFVTKGKEPKSQNAIIFTGDFDWSRENRYKANALIEVLRIKLRERIREDLGGTYGVRIRGSFPHIPRERYRISIEFGTDPERIDELTSEIFTQIDSIVQFGTTETYLSKVKESDLRSYETNLKQNGFWINNLEFKYFHGEDPMDILTYPQMVKSLSLEDIRVFARKLLDTDNYIRVVLLPEEQSG